MSGKNYIPNKDNDFKVWLDNFQAALTEHLAAFGVSESDIEGLTEAAGAFATALPALATAKAAYHEAIKSKHTARKETEQQLRAVVRRVANHPAMTDAIRAQMGITIPDRIRTRHEDGPEVPSILLEPRAGMVVIHFGTDPGDEQTNGKPDWAMGCNIYRRKSTVADWSLIAFDTASPYVDVITGEPAVYCYRAAYRGTRTSDEGASSAESSIAFGGI